jgi:predicted ATPase
MPTVRSRLRSIYLSGFKSFAYSPLGKPGLGKDDPAYVGKRTTFGDVTVFLGANGAGKSNVVSAFRLLNFMLTGALQDFVGRGGGAVSLLHYGPRVTPRMQLMIEFTDDNAMNRYACTLAAAAPDTLIFTDEEVWLSKSGYAVPQQVPLGAGHKESQLEAASKTGDKKAKTASVVLNLLRSCRTYQFHDTSENAKLRKGAYVEDSKYLRSDAGNLAAFLAGLRQNHRAYYDLIVRTVGQVCPEFADFELAPSDRTPTNILLNWRGRHHGDYLLGPHQISDGTLRFMALAALFLQPPELMPSAIIIDEPELGLHPAALGVLADLVKGASERSQVIVATQSETFVNHFALEQIRPITHSKGESRFLDLEPSDFTHWLEEYSTGELWEKNVFGGGPRYD